MEREFNDMRLVCGIYLQLLEKAVPGDVYNICPGTLELDLTCQITSHHPHVKINQTLVRNNGIRPLCGNPAKLPGVVSNIPLPAFQDTLRRMLGAADTPRPSV
jgi:hypothetical protein